MMDDILSLQRRAFLQQTAGVMAMAGTGAGAEAAVPPQPGLVIYQQDDAGSVAFARAMHARGMDNIAAGDDMVRLWREQLRKLVVEDGCRLMGRTSYATYFVLRGLAAEHRIFPQYEQQVSSHSFDWLIQG